MRKRLPKMRTSIPPMVRRRDELNAIGVANVYSRLRPRFLGIAKTFSILRFLANAFRGRADTPGVAAAVRSETVLVDIRPVAGRAASGRIDGALGGVPVIARRLAGRAMEEDREVTMATEADSMCNLGDRKIGPSKQRLCSFDPALDDKPMRGKARRLPERVRKMPRTQGQRFRKLGKRNVFPEVVVDVFERALQVARGQLGPRWR